MMPPKSTLWKREPHTEGKHLVLESYLKAWFPIMGKRRRRILFVDGFAGPGKYRDGEEGSPLVAMRVWAEHSARPQISTEVVFYFIEENHDRAQHLEGLVHEWESKLPTTAKAHVREGSFGSSMKEVLDDLDKQGKS